MLLCDETEQRHLRISPPLVGGDEGEGDRIGITPPLSSPIKGEGLAGFVKRMFETRLPILLEPSASPAVCPVR